MSEHATTSETASQTASARPVVRMPLRVRYHECDQQGVVFNAHYLAYADMASFEHVTALFGSYAGLLERGFDMMVAESNLRFHAPCRFDDELVVEAHTEHVGNTSFTLRFVILRDGQLVTEITNRYVWLDTASERPTRPAEDIRDALAASVASG